MSNLDLSIILPAFLEEENLRLLLPRLKATLDSISETSEIVIVDTVKALDNTEDVCREYQVKYFNREKGNTYGDAIRTGIKKAQGRKIIFMDADGSHSPEFIPKLVEFKDSYDIIIASRYVDGGFTENSKVLIIMSRILNFSYSAFLNINCKDVSNSFKLYDAGLIKKLNLHCNNFDIVEEILYKISKNNKNIQIKEIPYTFKARIFGKTKRNLVIFIITYIFTMLKLKFGK